LAESALPPDVSLFLCSLRARRGKFHAAPERNPPMIERSLFIVIVMWRGGGKKIENEIMNIATLI
jgi:hypothetical protein